MKLKLCIVGGGITGLLISYFYKQKFKDHEILLIDQEPFPGSHASSRNSEVLHAGIYYPSNSLKRQFCHKGHTIWRILCHNWKIPTVETGKYLFAKNKSEFTALEKIYQQAEKNHVPKLRWADVQEIAKINNYANCSNAFYSGFTSVIDCAKALEVVFAQVRKQDPFCLLEQKVKGIEKTAEGFIVETDYEKLRVERVINAAGGGAIELRKKLGLNDLENSFLAGMYAKYSGDFFNEAMLYPVSNENNKSLGVHTCLNTEKSIRFGPNNYSVNTLNYQVTNQHWQQLCDEICENFKNIDASKLSKDQVGVRSQILKDGVAYNDFWIGTAAEHGVENYLELCGIDSPGLTAAPAIAQHVISLLD